MNANANRNRDEYSKDTESAKRQKFIATLDINRWSELMWLILDAKPSLD